MKLTVISILCQGVFYLQCRVKVRVSGKFRIS